MRWLDNWIKKRAAVLAAKQEAIGKPQLQRVVSEESERWRDSKEPWVTIIGDTVTEEGIQLALDWNDAFVKYLKSQGVAGIDETQVVQRWLAMISKQVADKLGERYNDTDGNVSEYQ